MAMNGVMAPGEAMADGDNAHNPKRALWLDAWSDPVAGVKAFTSCMRTADLNGDGDWRLVVADANKKLKVCSLRGQYNFLWRSIPK